MTRPADSSTNSRARAGAELAEQEAADRRRRKTGDLFGIGMFPAHQMGKAARGFIHGP
jgi:hypothetical protein